ncbi:hypothetical protein EB796_003140 [Bugula neritina]|uniref:Uncharacterized protein n=1 Tax=Bugula neritina TaxID=10212 RepID=A0A7J7KJV5_BUGNE|nr:hypothetical protein EB796_003140 [Bugula neritina]
MTRFVETIFIVKWSCIQSASAKKVLLSVNWSYLTLRSYIYIMSLMTLKLNILSQNKPSNIQCTMQFIIWLLFPVWPEMGQSPHELAEVERFLIITSIE